MNCITMYLTIDEFPLPHRSPSGVHRVAAEAIGRYQVARGAYEAAEAKFRSYHSALEARGVDHPTGPVARRLERLERRFSRTVGPRFEAEGAAIEAIRGVVGAGGAMRVGDRLWSVVEPGVDETRERLMTIELGQVVAIG